MPILSDDIALAWVGSDGREIESIWTSGDSQFLDFFADRMEWAGGIYDSPEQVFAAAQAVYRGHDVDGIGVRVSVVDGGKVVAHTLDDIVEVGP